MKYLTVIFALHFMIDSIMAQSTGTLIYSNAVTYPEDRYKEYKGSPYFFNDWVFAEVYSQNGDVFEGMVVNYNIFENVFEIRNGNQYVMMDPYFYWCVKVEKSENGEHMKDFQDSTLFIRGLIPDDEKKFVQVIYNGSRVKLLRDMYVAESVKTFQSVGKTIINKRFNRKDSYFLVIDGNYNEIDLNKKDIIKVLGHKDEMEQWLKDQNNKLKKDQEVSDFLLYAEETFFLN